MLAGVVAAAYVFRKSIAKAAQSFASPQKC
jgi:hypothetical protein